MNGYLTFCLLIIAVGCSCNNSAEMTGFSDKYKNVQNHNNSVSNRTAAVSNKNAKTLDCGDANSYNLVVEEDTSQDADDTFRKVLNVVVGDEIKTAIKIPTQADANGFSLNWAKKNKEGFEISIDYGSRYYFQKQFNFICKKGEFYLYQIKVESFDKHDRKSMENWDKKVIKIKPNLPIEKFSIFDYLVNE